MKSETELRELDAWIFKTVFKMTQHEIGRTSDGYDIFECVWLPPECPPYATHFDIMKHCWAFVPRFTTDPAHAMLVLEKCIERGYTPLLSQAFHLNAQRELFSCRNGETGDEHASSETLPLAICLFAKEIFK